MEWLLLIQVISAVFGLVKQGILGFQEVKNLAYSVPATDLFRMGSEGIDIRALWDQTLRIAVLARRIGYHIRYPIPEEVFVAAILHDIGMVILNQLLGNEYLAVVRAGMETNDLESIEEDLLGTTHTQVGQRLVDKWQLPDNLQRAVLRHHNPVTEEKVGKLPGLLQASDLLANCLSSEEDLEAALSKVHPLVREKFQLDTKMLRPLLEKTRAEYLDIRQIFTPAAPS